jgi:hypothetical protein
MVTIGQALEKLRLKKRRKLWRIAKSGPYKGTKVLNYGKHINKPLYYSWQIFGKKKKKYSRISKR